MKKFTYSRSPEMRILSAFMAFLIFTLTFQQAFVGWDAGIRVKAAAANGEIHSTNTDKSSILKTEIQTRADTAASGTSPYTYSGKYTNNNKVTVFDYVSDYELAHSYNDCWQYEDNYDDAFTAFNRAISNDHAEGVALSENITVVFKPLDQEIINQHTSNNQKVHVYFFGGTSSTHNWPGAEMTYNTVTGEFYYTAKYTDLNSPTGLIINNKNSEGSNTDERLWQTENLTGLSAGKIYTVTQNNDITSTNHILIKFKDNIDTSNTSRYAYMWQNSNSNNNNNWAGAKMTELGNSLYSYELPSTDYDRLIINDKGGKGNWQSSDQALKTTNGVRVYYYFTRFSSSTSLTRYITVDTSTADNYPSTKYTNPLYFGCFYAGNSKDDYGDKPLYNNFFWQANMGLKATGSGSTQQLAYRGSTVVQGLVDDNLYGGATGNLLEKGSSALVLPYFDEEWAKANPALMKYYNKDGTKDITFPFYEVTTTDTSLSNVKIKDGENLTGGNLGTNEKARFYQFKSSDANLQFTNFDSDDHTGYFKESDVDIVSGYWYDTGDLKDPTKPDIPDNHRWSTHPWADSTRSNVGFFPFNTNNDGDSDGENKHNLGFGTKFEMSFQLEPDGCVRAVKTDADGTNVRDADSDTRIHTVFEFEGDDDLWVFIDGKLVLDMGGDHNKSHGIIDFAEKTVTVDKEITLGDGSSKDDLGADIRTPTSSPNNSVKDLKTLLPSDSFKDSKYTNTTHTMTIFYMERGMKDSNLLVRFNYSPISNASKMKIAEVTKFDDVNPGLLSLTKKVAEDDIFQYIVSNKGTAKADVNENTAFTNDNNYTKVYFSDGTNRTVEITLASPAEGVTGAKYGYGYMFQTSSFNDTGGTSHSKDSNDYYLVNVVEPSSQANGVTVTWSSHTTSDLNNYIWVYYGTNNTGMNIRAYYFNTSSGAKKDVGGNPYSKNVSGTTYYFGKIEYNSGYDKVMFFNENSEGQGYYMLTRLDVSTDLKGKVYTKGNYSYKIEGNNNVWDGPPAISKPNGLQNRDINVYDCDDVTSTYGNATYFGSETTTYTVNTITFPNTPASPTTYTVTYQPEDRYGMISTQNTSPAGVLGANDVNNYIYINTTLSDPYIMFYSDANGTSGNEIGGTAPGISLKLATLNGTDVATTTGTANLYKVRLPKNAKSFIISDGTTTGTAQALYENLDVKVTDGTLYSGGADDHVTVNGFHHAGTTFTINSSCNVSGKTLRTGYTVTRKAAMTDPLNPRSDADYVFFTDTGNTFANSGTVYAYFYGGADGEYHNGTATNYTPWPGIKATTANNGTADTTYTDNDGNKVYMFRLPRGENGTYPYVIFNNGVSGIKITQAAAVVAGRNYVLNTTPSGQYGTFAVSGNVYPVRERSKAESNPTIDYGSSSSKYIYIVNNGPHDLNGGSRTPLDDMHIVFYDSGKNVIGTGSPGYKPDKVVAGGSDKQYSGSDVYRIAAPSNAKYFQITNGTKAGTTYDYERMSEIKEINADGLYRFVPLAANAVDYIEETSIPTKQSEAHFLLDIVNVVTVSDEEISVNGTVPVHIATIVTGSDGKTGYIKWVKDYDPTRSPAGSIDTAYIHQTGARAVKSQLQRK